MSNTDPAGIPVITRPAPVAPPRWGLWLAGVAVVAVVLGLAGGVISHAMFPVHNGHNGHNGAAGPQGNAGEAGPAGPAGTPGADTNLSTIGYCFNTGYTNDPYSNYSYVSSVSLSAPTDVNGTQTCPNGSFVPLQPSTQPPA
jgi:hypothetical protein